MHEVSIDEEFQHEIQRGIEWIKDLVGNTATTFFA